MNASAADSRIRLYELVMENGASASPYVWRTRYALAHKDLPFTTVPVGFTEIPKVAGGRFKTVPFIEDAELSVGDSWAIAEYLDRTYGQRPLFCGPAELAMVRFFDAWFSMEVMRRMFRVYALNIHDAARPEDRGYFRESRENFLKGVTLEAFTADRVSQLSAVRSALNPLRHHLSRAAFLGGDMPNYADYIALSAFRWVASVSDLPLLAKDDPLIAWLDRGFDLYGGLARDPRMNPLVE